MTVEILYTAWNRLEFTRVTFELLKRNTDWQHVSRLVVYDDGSEDGTREYLADAGLDIPVEAFELRDRTWNALGATMNDYVAECDTEAFVKIDNDIAMPSGWLPILISCAERHPEYELIGMEAGWTGPYKGVLRRSAYSVTPAKHIGGVGLMRVKAFNWRRPVPMGRGRAGFTIWQHRHHLRAGWLTPDLPNVQLDRIPEEPWRTLSERYVELGWARAWEPYVPDMKRWWKWLPARLLAKAA